MGPGDVSGPSGAWWGGVPDRAELVDGYVVQPCGRCRQRPAGEVCWWCGGRLCRACWGEVGHCGHEGADSVSEADRAAMYLRRLERARR